MNNSGEKPLFVLLNVVSVNSWLVQKVRLIHIMSYCWICVTVHKSDEHSNYITHLRRFSWSFLSFIGSLNCWWRHALWLFDRERNDLRKKNQWKTISGVVVLLFLLHSFFLYSYWITNCSNKSWLVHNFEKENHFVRKSLWPSVYIWAH